MKLFQVIRPGSYSTIQDAGRPGLRRYGIPSSGALDQFSWQAANLLLGNHAGNAALEITFGGVALETLAPTHVAVTGGDLGTRLNEQPLEMWTVVELRVGDKLSFTQRVAGCRAYLGVRGGFDAPKFLGSKSTFYKGQMGRPLKAGDTLSVAGFMPHTAVPRSVYPQYRPRFGPGQTIRVILGPQADHFTSRGIETFLKSQYTLDAKSDRQGFRLDGPPVEILKGPGIISDPTPLGAVQVPGDGCPIILMREGQVTGGYAKIAVVIRADIDRLAQIAPGESFRFQSVTRDEALDAIEEKQRILKLIPAMRTSGA